MKFIRSFAVALLVLMTSPASAADGLIAVKSPYSSKESMENRHGVPQCPVVGNLNQALAGFAQVAVAK